MSLVRWTPMRELRTLQDEMDRLFESAMRGGDGGAEAPTLWRPQADIRETLDEYHIRLDLPGVDKKNVKVSLFGDTLQVRGERREETEQKDMKWHRVERYHGEFERTFQLPSAVQPDRVQASFRDGVLEIRVPKAEAAKPREIPIQVDGS